MEILGCGCSGRWHWLAGWLAGWLADQLSNRMSNKAVLREIVSFEQGSEQPIVGDSELGITT